PATANKVNREITINYREDLNNSQNDVSLYFGQKNLNPKLIKSGEGYLDLSDGGIALVAESNETAIIEITIRQDTEIEYTIGNYYGSDEMPVELIVRPIIQTGTLYAMPPLVPTSIGDANLRKIIDSNGGLTTGTKVWAIDSFQDGKSYNFTVNPNSKTNNTLRILLVKLEDVLKCVASFDASDNAELDQLEIFEDLIGWIKSRSFYSEIDLSLSQSFSLKPTRTRYLLAFDASNPATPGYTDTVISSYSKNTIDPYEGGTFTFLGF
ncbi:MAG: hypothetical protein ACRC78_12695, partial [Planktothrix sp.]